MIGLLALAVFLRNDELPFPVPDFIVEMNSLGMRGSCKSTGQIDERWDLKGPTLLKYLPLSSAKIQSPSSLTTWLP
jgi:hypothetical protein